MTNDLEGAIIYDAKHLFLKDQVADEKLPTFGKINKSANMSSNAITRPELNAKLETIEARMDARVQNIENTVEHLSASVDELKKEFRSVKWWAIGTAIGAIGTIVSVIQINTSWQQQFLNSMDAKTSAIMQIQQDQAKILNAIEKKSDK